MVAAADIDATEYPSPNLKQTRGLYILAEEDWLPVAACVYSTNFCRLHLPKPDMKVLSTLAGQLGVIITDGEGFGAYELYQQHKDGVHLDVAWSNRLRDWQQDRKFELRVLFSAFLAKHEQVTS